MLGEGSDRAIKNIRIGSDVPSTNAETAALCLAGLSIAMPGRCTYLPRRLSYAHSFVRVAR